MRKILTGKTCRHCNDKHFRAIQYNQLWLLEFPSINANIPCTHFPRKYCLCFEDISEFFEFSSFNEISLPSFPLLHVKNLSPFLTIMSSIYAGGLIWVSDWNALQHPVASAFLAVLYSDYMLSSRTARLSCDGNSYKPSDLRKFAISQVCGLHPVRSRWVN